ncbi:MULTISPECIES: MarR family winged helix-turn-helix transcriptional regulator [Paenibacillus]|uniref:MarR family winged helix-turn-helix transcriptional regulator n=1 Tax=Paenibacillus TaxID=44249 RepID=UPI000382725B|nr:MULTISPECIES: MarR family transcriptional regulator [Paenibacillus]
MPELSSQEIFNQIHGLHRQLTSTFERCAGISASRLQLLCQLYQSDEISQSSLQKLVGIDHAAITRHVKQLEAENMVIRRISPEDNRFTLVQLTEHGREKIIAFREERETFLNRMLDGFSSSDQDQLSDMLMRINQNISQL